MKKYYIYTMKESDNENFPCGEYFLDVDSYKIYVTPQVDIPKRKFNITSLVFFAILIGVVLTLLIGITISGMILNHLFITDSLLHWLLFFSCIITIIFVIIACLYKKGAKKLSRLAEAVECREVICDEREEHIFLMKIIKNVRSLFILYLISILLTVGSAHLLMIYPSHIVHIFLLEGIYTAIFYGFVAGSLMFVTCSMLLRQRINITRLAKQKLRILRGEIGND